MYFNNMRKALATAVLTALAGMTMPTQAADSTWLGVSQTVPSAQSVTQLGTSSNPMPGSTGMPTTPSAMPAQTMMGPNGTMLAYPQQAMPQATQLQQTMVAPPAWAQGALRSVTSIQLQPFASNLFEGRFASTFSDAASNDYILAPGDRIVVRIWGIRAYDDVLVVDQQGNIFIPEVGPVHVGSLTNS